MKANVTRTADINRLVLQHLLSKDGKWLVTVNRRRIESLTHFPREQTVAWLLRERRLEPGSPCHESDDL